MNEHSMSSEAEYALETRVLCPNCSAEIEELKVVRLLRQRVNFTSTLPRRGYVTVCPKCGSIMSAALTSL